MYYIYIKEGADVRGRENDELILGHREVRGR